MNIDNQRAPSRDVPVPPSGGSWTFDEVKWAWVSNDPLPQAEEAVAAAQGNNINIEQE